MGQTERLIRFFGTFTGRMILGVLLIHILLTPLLFFGILLIVERSFESQFIDQVRNDTLLYASLLKPAVVNKDQQQQIELLEGIHLSGDIIFAEITNNDGLVTRIATDAAMPEFREDFYFGEHEDVVYFISTQLFNDVDSEPLGRLTLGYDEMPVQAQIDAAYRFGSLLAVCYIALSMLLVIFFGRLLIRP